MVTKTERKLFATYLNSNFAGVNNGSYCIIGGGLEELTVEMGANVNKTADVLGNTDTFIDKYEKSQSVEPYYYDKDDSLSEALQNIVDGDLTLNDLNTDIIDVKLWTLDAVNNTCEAIKEECVVEVVSYGGDTSAYVIPFNIHRIGGATKVKGTFDIVNKTFTA